MLCPSGLTEYLKHAAITEEQRRNLDEMEDEFYASFGNALKAVRPPSALPPASPSVPLTHHVLRFADMHTLRGVLPYLCPVPACLSVCLSVCLSICQSLRIYVCLMISLSPQPSHLSCHSNNSLPTYSP